MAKVKRNCDNCGVGYTADTRNLKRGWGKCCSKSCAASLREEKKPNYDPVRVEVNKIRRKNWVRNGLNIKAQRRGYPDFNTMIEDQSMEDGSWDEHGGVELSICNICNLRANFCQCGDY